MLFPNSCRCSVGGETIRPSSQSSRVRYPYSAPLFFSPFFFFLFFFSMGGGVLCMFLFFFATHHPPVITTCSWGSVGHCRPWTHTSDDSYAKHNISMGSAAMRGNMSFVLTGRIGQWDDHKLGSGSYVRSGRRKTRKRQYRKNTDPDSCVGRADKRTSSK